MHQHFFLEFNELLASTVGFLFSPKLPTEATGLQKRKENRTKAHWPWSAVNTFPYKKETLSYFEAKVSETLEYFKDIYSTKLFSGTGSRSGEVAPLFFGLNSSLF